MQLPSELRSSITSQSYSPHEMSLHLCKTFRHIITRLKPSQNSDSTSFVPRHISFFRRLPTRRQSTDTSTPNFSALFVIQPIVFQPFSLDTQSADWFPPSYFTSVLDIATLIVSDVQTA